jgi:hypothetical protein
LVILVAAPALYLLTLPVVAWVGYKANNADIRRVSVEPAWLLKYAGPWIWLRKTPVGPAQDRYFTWVMRKLEGIP